MIRSILAVVLALATLPVFAAGNTKESLDGASRACATVRPADARVLIHPLWFRNISLTESVRIACSPSVEGGANGTTDFGAVITNNRQDNRVVECTAYVNSGGNGVKEVKRSILVGPLKNRRITWTAGDMGWNTFVGGQAGFECTLPPGTAIQWIFSHTVHGS